MRNIKIEIIKQSFHRYLVRVNKQRNHFLITIMIIYCNIDATKLRGKKYLNWLYSPKAIKYDTLGSIAIAWQTIGCELKPHLIQNV